MIAEHLPNIKGLIIDMDGVLWRGSQPIGDLESNFKKLQDSGLQFILATNNATRTISENLEKLAQYGVTLKSEYIINTAEATGQYLLDHFGTGTYIYVIGQPSLVETLQNYGLKVVDYGHPDIAVVVVSFDLNLTYEKLKHASLLVQSGSVLVGTNPDTTLPTPEGLIPGSGTTLKAVEMASNHSAIVIGKPEPILYKMALERLGLLPSETLAIGDRLEIDILGAQKAGIRTALVLSGVSTLADVEGFNPKPDIIVNDFRELLF